MPEQLLEAQKRSTPFPKAIAKFKLQAFPKGENPLLNPYLRTAFPQFSKALDPERLHFTLVGLFAGFTIVASCARAAPGSPKEKQAFYKSNCQIQTPSLSQRSKSLIKPLLKNSFSTILQGPGPGEAPFHFSRFVCWVHYCSKLCQGSSWKPKREASLLQKQLPIQTPSLSQRSKSLIKLLLKNSFSTIFQGPGPAEAPFHFSRFVCWAHYCSKLCQSSSWKPRREARLFQKQLPNSNPKPFPKEQTPY